MEKLAEQVNEVFTAFFRDENGNRLSPWAFVSFKETVMKTIKDYKPSNDGGEILTGSVEKPKK